MRVNIKSSFKIEPFLSPGEHHCASIWLSFKMGGGWLYFKARFQYILKRKVGRRMKEMGGGRLYFKARFQYILKRNFGLRVRRMTQF